MLFSLYINNISNKIVKIITLHCKYYTKYGIVKGVIKMNRYYKYKDSDLDVRYTLDEKPNTKDFHMHTHDFCELYYLIHGKGFFRIEGNKYPLRSGDIFILRNSESHYIDIDETHPYERMTIHFNERILDSIDSERELLIPFNQREVGNFNRFERSNFKTNSYQLFLQNIMSSNKNNRIQIITSLLPLLNELSIAFSSYSNTQDNEKNDSLSYKIVSFINKRITEDICLNDICKEFFISKSQLCKLFRTATGSTVWDYIILKRLIYVRELIHSGITPTKAYTMGGFTDYSVFYRNYRKKYGCSPSNEFRNNANEI